MDLLRTILFTIIFYGASVPAVLIVPVAGLFGRKTLRHYANRWSGLFRWSARKLLRIDVRIIGEIPTGAVIFAAKHESIFEAIDLTRTIGTPATVMKRELSDIPIWGWAAKRYGAIIVDREANAAALRAMMRDAKAAKAEGRAILIFPEGTRVGIGESPPLRAGFAGLYRMLGVPVVPVAVKSAHVWPREAIKHPGEVIYQFGEPIPAGLPRDEIEARVHAAINALNR